MVELIWGLVALLAGLGFIGVLCTTFGLIGSIKESPLFHWVKRKEAR